MDIGFFVNYGDKVMQLPVNPEKVKVTCKGNNTSSEVIKLGEITLLKSRKLKEISFESFLPYEEWFPGIRTLGDFKKPSVYKKFFEGIMNDEKPCRLVITGIGIDLKCSLEDFEYYHQAGDHEDAYYSLKFKEYQDYEITELKVETKKKSSKKKKKKKKKKSTKATKITVGCSVILNGRVHYNSMGAKPGKTFKNYKGKVNLINKKGTHPYHVTTPSGGWLGWVTKESVVLA